MVLQELESFTFATALDLNMGYYILPLDWIQMHPKPAQSSSLGTNTSMRLLPMGIADSPDFFHAKMMELMESLEYVQAYIYDLLWISRNSLEDHLEKLEEVLRRLHNAGLKVNADAGAYNQPIYFILFIADLLYVGFVPLVDCVDINDHN